MRIRICPVCKKLVPEGSLKASEDCFACSIRTNEDDLTITDTESILNSTGSPQAPEQSVPRRQIATSLQSLILPQGFAWENDTPARKDLDDLFGSAAPSTSKTLKYHPKDSGGMLFSPYSGMALYRYLSL